MDPEVAILVSKTDEDTLTLRQATLLDLDGIALLAQEAFPDDPERDYRFPYRSQHPKDNAKWTRREYEMYLEEPKLFQVMIVEARSTRNRVDNKIVALCVWDIRHLTGHHEPSPPLILGEDSREDANIIHMRRFNEVIGSMINTYFQPYGNQQVILANLATHPNYRRRGCGGALCQWGMKKAAEKGWVVTVLGSPMGRLLYLAQGFQELGVEPLAVEGDDEMLHISSLVYSS